MTHKETQAAKDLAWFKQCLENKSLIAALNRIKLITCDVDGTLTDSHVYVDADGEGGRQFSTQDGFIVKYVLGAGITLSLISGKDNPSTVQRAKKLNIPEDLCIVGTETKPAEIEKLQKKLKISPDQTLHIGDDFLDFEVKMSEVALLLACPENTPFYLQPIADIVIPRHGGNGAFRLLMDMILFARQKHFAQMFIAARTL